MRPAALVMLLLCVAHVGLSRDTSETIESSITYAMFSINDLHDKIVSGVQDMAVAAGNVVDLKLWDSSIGLADLNYSYTSQPHIADLNTPRYHEFWVTQNAARLDPDIAIDQSIGGWDACACREEWEAFCNATAAVRAEGNLSCMTCNRACEVLMGRRLGTSFDNHIGTMALNLPVMQIWYIGRGNGTENMDWGCSWSILDHEANDTFSLYHSNPGEIIPYTGGNAHSELVMGRNASDKKSAHWTEPLVDYWGRTYMALGSPIWSKYGEFLGGVYAAIHTTTMQTFFVDLAESSEMDSRVVSMLTLKDGTLWASTAEARMTVFGSNSTSQNITSVDIRLSEILAETQAGETLEIMKKYYEVKIRGTTYVVFGQRLESISWYAFFFVEKAVLFPSTNSNLIAVLCGVLIPCITIALAVCGIAFLVMQRMREKVHELEEHLGSVSKTSITGTPAEEAVVVLLGVLKKRVLSKLDRKALINVVSLIANNKLFRADSNLKEKVDQLKIGSNAGAFLIDILQSAPAQKPQGLAFGRAADETASVTQTSEVDTVMSTGGDDLDDDFVKVSSIPLQSWDCDVETVTTGDNVLEMVAMQCFEQIGVIEKWDLPRNRIRNFVRAIEAGYIKSNHYHNNIHAADVTQAVFFLMTNCALVEFTPIEKLAAIFAAIVHDYRHGGLNNNFLRATLDPLYIRFNGRSVLESMHVSESFLMMMSSSKFKFVEGKLKPEELFEFHSLVTQLVLATDMSSHIELTSQFTARERALVDGTAGASSGKEYRELLLKMLLKFADISNSSRRWPVYHRWVGRVISEFFAQGDKERSLKLPVSAFMDRNATDVPKCQETFITFVVMPLAELIARAVPAVRMSIIPHLEENKSKVHGLTNTDFDLV